MRLSLAAFRTRFAPDGAIRTISALHTQRNRKGWTACRAGAAPAVESGFQAHVYSPNGAAGLWQFMPATGSMLEPEQDWWFDKALGLGNRPDRQSPTCRNSTSSFRRLAVDAGRLQCGCRDRRARHRAGETGAVTNRTSGHSTARVKPIDMSLRLRSALATVVADPRPMASIFAEIDNRPCFAFCAHRMARSTWLSFSGWSIPLVGLHSVSVPSIFIPLCQSRSPQCPVRSIHSFP